MANSRANEWDLDQGWIWNLDYLPRTLCYGTYSEEISIFAFTSDVKPGVCFYTYSKQLQSTPGANCVEVFFQNA